MLCYFIVTGNKYEQQTKKTDEEKLEVSRRRGTKKWLTEKDLRMLKQEKEHVSPYFRFAVLVFLIQFVLTMIAKNIWRFAEGNQVMCATHGCRGERPEGDKFDATVKDIILYVNNFRKRTNYFSKYLFLI